jgi:murein L,D-transpeptidase YafK
MQKKRLLYCLIKGKLTSSLMLIFVLFACKSNTSKLIGNEQKTLKTIVTERKISGDALKIFIEKEKRTLSVFYNDEKLISYPCVLGFSPTGDKMKEGDGKTPEGKFGIRSMYKHKNWSYFIWIDYPNEESWKRFNSRKKSGEIDSKATIGGEIGIHGVPAGNDDLIKNVSDWTLGCVSLTTNDITDLYQAISLKTKIEIVK